MQPVMDMQFGKEAVDLRCKTIYAKTDWTKYRLVRNKRLMTPVSSLTMALLLQIAIVVLPSVTGSLVIKPENQAILVNQTAEMKCTTNESTGTQLLWHTKSSNSDDNVVLYSEHKLSTSVEDYIQFNNSIFGQHDLIVKGTPNAGHRYTCIEPGSHETASAELLIITNQVCIDSSNDTYFNATCIIRFTGNWPPEMHWTVNGEYVPQEHVASETKRNESVTSRLLSPRYSTANLIACNTNFSEHWRPSETTAKNVPTYTSIWPNSAKAMPPDLTKENPCENRRNARLICKATCRILLFLSIAVTISFAIFCIITPSCRKETTSTDVQDMENGQRYKELVEEINEESHFRSE